MLDEALKNPGLVFQTDKCEARLLVLSAAIGPPSHRCQMEFHRRRLGDIRSSWPLCQEGMTLTYSGAKGTGVFFQWDGESLAMKLPFSGWTLRAMAQKVTLRLQSDWRALPHTHPQDYECSCRSLRSWTVETC